ncbi:serine/threonine protein kinase, partial [Sphaeroforma arctica JP610]
MKKLEHVNIVTCVGIATGPPLAIVMELMTMGDLYTYLRSQDERECYVTDAQRLYTIYQVARAMHYLSNHGVVHRDLAARNCMMSPPRAGTFGFPIVRVSDFGLSREISDTENYYKMQSHDKLPIHWMAVEAIVDRKFSVASDVWSFAVVAWEVFGDACAKPHQNLNVFQMLEYYKSGKRLLQPAKCPD